MIYHHIAALVEKAVETELIMEADRIYARNQVLGKLNLTDFPEDIDAGVRGNHAAPEADTVTSGHQTNRSIPNILADIIDYAITHHVIDDTLDAKEILSADIMNCFVARPSVVNQTFNEKYALSPQAATDYFYALSQNNNYIQTERIKKNIHYQAKTNYGKLDITINLSKPEKDPEQIKREREMKQAIRYPKCPLCVENEGYPGRVDHPARANHRVIHVPLNGEDWYFQYSPYVYYNEHSIVLSGEHRDMKINQAAFDRLLTFTEKFPHYFIGSNADLPVVGGSILTHDHYQAGRYEFAMMRAKEKYTFSMDAHQGVHASVLEWPLSVIQLQSTSKQEILDAADTVLNTWKQYSDPNAAIFAYSGATPHNTITPIARKRGETYILDLVLRNNRTSTTYPLGIFHPHESVQHIKKENIGLIEVMGLAVLPARLKDELKEIESFLTGGSHQIAEYHVDWARILKHKHGTVHSAEEAHAIVQQELGYKFATVLEHAGVFKHEKSWRRFTQTLA